jgi:putative large structural protein
MGTATERIPKTGRLTSSKGATGNPTLQLENYDAAGMEAFFQDANAQAGDVDSWIALVVNNVGMQRAAWESDADMQIQAYIDNLNVSDNYNGVANYRDALLKELNSQKEAALQIWERTANTDIYLQLENYLTNLTGGIYDDAVGNTDSSLSNTNGISQNTRLTPEQIQQQFNQSRQQWETQFQDSTDKGLKEYGDSLTAINDNYNRFVDQLDSADVNFQQNLQAIQDYKQNVISGISSTVDNLKGFLDNPANESLFGTSSNRLPAGTELQALIDKFTTKIASMGTNDFSLILTQLASDMTSYLDKQVNLTTVTRNTMASKVDVRSMNNIPNGNPDMLHWSETDRGGVPQAYWADPQDNLTDGYKQIKAYRDVIDANGNRTATENDLINYVKNRWYKGQDNLSFKIIDANMFAYSNVAPGQPYWGTWGMNQNYAKSKDAFWWFGAYKPGGADQFRQETFGFKIDYMVHDKDMQTNTITFTGFVNQLTAHICCPHSTS